MEDLIHRIKEIDTKLFLYLNGIHNDFFDTVMYWVSHKNFWIPLYVFFLYLVYKHIGKRTWLVLVFVALLVILSDQLCLHAFKYTFLRYRPSHNLVLESQVHIVNDYRGGKYGFVSSHAANSFAIATFLFLFFKDKIKRFGFLIFFWAALVSYSRIYLGVHYPADIAVGTIIGIGLAIMVFKFYVLADKKLLK